MKELLKPVVVLTVICVVASALLGLTYDKTAPLIAQAEKEASDAAMQAVVPGSTTFTELALEGMENNQRINEPIIFVWTSCYDFTLYELCQSFVYGFV